jgi:serine/threonine-protein kinase
MPVVDTVCQTCGFAAGRDAGDTGGLCPRCLLRAALGPPPDLLPRAFGKYRLLEQLDRGGMGIVFRAHDPGGDRQVALKMLREGELASAADRQRFEEEARKAAGLHHDGIVPVLDVDTHEGQPYFTMRLMEGGSLARRIGAGDFKGRSRDAARLVADVARAIHYAHQRFVLHRDLKPANILLDAAGRPHIGDFGIARRLDEEVGTSAEHLMGTLPYMAPEQVQTPKDLTVSVDVYGAGAILYELLCGQPPATGATMAELVTSVVDHAPRSPRRLLGPGAIDVDLDTICMKCLRKAPGERYASAAGLAADLDRYLADEPIAARPPTMPERVRRVLRRHPAAAAMGATALALLVGTTVAAVSVAHAQEDELRAEVLKVNAYAARALSGALLYELRELGDAVARAASDPAVRDVLEHPGDEAAIAAWRARPHPARFDSLQILSPEGRWVARAPRPQRDFTGLYFDWREYFAGAARLGRTGARGVHVSRPYVSTADGTTRFSLVAPVYDDGEDGDGRWLGVLEGAVDSATALGALTLIDPDERQRIAAVVARRDRERREDPLPDDWLVLLHDGVARGSHHLMDGRGALATLGAAARGAVSADDHRDPIPGFAGRWLAGVAPVGDTPFAVIVQTRYETAVGPNQRLARRGLAAAALALAGAAGSVVLLALVRARRRR